MRPLMCHDQDAPRRAPLRGVPARYQGKTVTRYTGTHTIGP
jgi:hypothetical protein